MNRLLLRPEELSDAGVAELRGRRATHILNVLRPQVGERLRAGVARGPVGEAEIRELGDARVLLQFTPSGDAPEPPDVDLILALPRPKALSRTVQAASTLGVRHIYLVNAWRVERAYFQSPRVAEAALEEDAWLGCEQGGGTWVPEVSVHRLLMPFLEALPLADDSVRLLAQPRADGGLETCTGIASGAPLAVAIGPEGGWIDREIDSLTALRFQPFELGLPVLRVDTAVTACLAQLALLRRLTR